MAPNNHKTIHKGQEILKHLKRREISAKGKKQAIQSKAQEHNILIEVTKAKVIEGGKSKKAWIY
jgi:hypothetical protein